MRAAIVAIVFVACGPIDDRPTPVPPHAGVAPEGARIAFERETMPPWYREGGFYRYAPSIVEVSPEVRYAWSCGNVIRNQVKDHLVMRKATRGSSGWSWSEETIALGPREEREVACTGFDCYHTCDPELIEGDFVHGGARRRFALLYTGNDLDASAHCAVGVAFADSLDGPWQRAEAPLVPYPCDDAAPYSWGVGQPSATTLGLESGDDRGRFHLFARVQCGRVSKPMHWTVDLGVDPPRIEGPTSITTAGLTTPAGAPDDTLNNGAFLYDPLRDRFVTIRSQHPMPTSVPKQLSTSLQIAAIDGPTMLAGAGPWQPLGDVAPTDDGAPTWVSGHARNSNPAFVRTTSGLPVDPDRLEIAYTATDALAFPSWVWSNRIHVVGAKLVP